ncbi:hypothetical protein GF402_11385 [Candidatus Fermentibacteria bacterium]|nr:hypothetical protein [Candidatus Fermentibacteria bacterium]
MVRTEKNAQDLLRRIEAATRASSVKVYAWALTAKALRILLRAGREPLSIFVRKILSGHALQRLYRHGEEGPLVSGRYRCVLVEERSYFLHLVRDIHAAAFYEGEVSSLDQLGGYDWHGHRNLTGKNRCEWQDTSYVLGKFSSDVSEARKMYREFVRNAPPPERRPGLHQPSAPPSGGTHDPRVLGSREFTMSVLRNQEVEPKGTVGFAARKAEMLEELMVKVCDVTGVSMHEMLGRSKRRAVSSARALVSYVGVFHLGMTYKAVSDVLGITPSAVYMASGRGRAMVAANDELKRLVCISELCEV